MLAQIHVASPISHGDSCLDCVPSGRRKTRRRKQLLCALIQSPRKVGAKRARVCKWKRVHVTPTDAPDILKCLLPSSSPPRPLLRVSFCPEEAMKINFTERSSFMLYLLRRLGVLSWIWDKIVCSRREMLFSPYPVEMKPNVYHAN